MAPRLRWPASPPGRIARGPARRGGSPARSLEGAGPSAATRPSDAEDAGGRWREVFRRLEPCEFGANPQSFLKGSLGSCGTSCWT